MIELKNMKNNKSLIEGWKAVDCRTNVEQTGSGY